jgi:hypothetical protein
LCVWCVDALEQANSGAAKGILPPRSTHVKSEVSYLAKAIDPQDLNASVD